MAIILDGSHARSEADFKLNYFLITGVRLTAHAAHRLVREDGQFALITACAAGGQVSEVLF